MLSIKKSRLLLIIPRFWRAMTSVFPKTKAAFQFAITSKETSTFTYNLTATNRKYLIQTIAIVTQKTFQEIETYFLEAENNETLKAYVIEKIKNAEEFYKKDLRCDFGSRVAWYAIIRANKSKTVVENGVEMGYNAVLLCEALLKNKEEGSSGKFYGLDINKKAGYFINDKKYDAIKEIIVDDAMVGLTKITNTIDFYFSDGVRTEKYETTEFEKLKIYLNDKSIVVTNKSNFSTALLDFSIATNFAFLYFQEEPYQHWYPGSGLGIAYKIKSS